MKTVLGFIRSRKFNLGGEYRGSFQVFKFRPHILALFRQELLTTKHENSTWRWVQERSYGGLHKYMRFLWMNIETSYMVSTVYGVKVHYNMCPKVSALWYTDIYLRNQPRPWWSRLLLPCIWLEKLQEHRPHFLLPIHWQNWGNQARPLKNVDSLRWADANAARNWLR